MWVVQPEYEGNGHCTLAIINLDCIAQATHLLPVYGSTFLPEDFHFSDALDVFRAYFVNPYVDHHSHEFLRSLHSPTYSTPVRAELHGVCTESELC
jgi:hypothetical protein